MAPPAAASDAADGANIDSASADNDVYDAEASVLAAATKSFSIRSSDENLLDDTDEQSGRLTTTDGEINASHEGVSKRAAKRVL